jgi:hypothetical protein
MHLPTNLDWRVALNALERWLEDHSDPPAKYGRAAGEPVLGTSIIPPSELRPAPSEPSFNQIGLSRSWAFGGACAGLQASPLTWAWTMALDPEELVTLTGHGTMKLRLAVARAMMLLAKERKRAMIVREGEPATLKFEQIKSLAAEWAESLLPLD